MEQNINIAEILKDKPIGTSLWSMILGKCTLRRVDNDDKYPVSVDSKNARYSGCYSCKGRCIEEAKDSECILFPSKRMRSWSRFAWKKGDVLVNQERDAHIVFEKFTDYAYTTFIGKYYNVDKGYSSVCRIAVTKRFSLEKEDATKAYINTIEEKYGGKLNLETLEIEKQPEFKDGDIVVCDLDTILLVKEISSNERVYFYAYMKNGICVPQSSETNYYGYVYEIRRFATDTEKQQLFDALKKEGKAWDAEEKQIVDLPKQYEFQPFDKVLVRNYDTDDWFPGFFEKFDSTWNNPYHIMNFRSLTDFAFKQCIPYNENTKHLLGTTDDPK